MTPLERFDAVMAYEPVDRVPNWELGAGPHARQRWVEEGWPTEEHGGDWFSGLPQLGMDPKIFAPLNFKLLPLFERVVMAEDDETVTARNHLGIVTKALKTGSIGGARMSMDQYLQFPVECAADWRMFKERLDPTDPERYPADWEAKVAEWKTRDCPLVLGRNCSVGFYWNAREWLGTEGLSIAFYEQPSLLHDMFEFLADFTIEVTRRARHDISFDYFCLNEDIAFKTAPLLSPQHYREFIIPPMTRLIETLKRDGVRYVCLDTDGNCGPLIPDMMRAGVDILWPLEQAAEGMRPGDLRRRYGRDLRLWGGVDKRVVAAGGKALDDHLTSLRPLIEAGGYVPHLDHTFPPDIGAHEFEDYWKKKEALLRGEGG